MKTIMKIDQFNVEVEEAEEGGYIASVPVLPACHTQGKTIKELTDNIREVIEGCLEIAQKDPQYQAQILEREKSIKVPEKSI